MNEQPFLHRRGVDVPEDVKWNVRHLIVGASESEGIVGGSESEGVLEDDLFWEDSEDLFWDYDSLENGLERLGFQEGTLKIGGWATFEGCDKLRRVDFPSSLRWIGDGVFERCESLSEINLQDGLRGIGRLAFQRHSCRQITIPSSVIQIGERAFAEGTALREVTLAGGMVMLDRDAFRGCNRLRNIAIPSMAIVVEEGDPEGSEFMGNGRAELVTSGMIKCYLGGSPNRLILTSTYLTSMQSEDDNTRVTDVTRVIDAINRIADVRREDIWTEGPLNLLSVYTRFSEEEDWIRVHEGANRIRSRFLSLLSAHRRALASIVERTPLWGSAEGGVEPGVVENILSFLGDIEG